MEKFRPQLTKQINLMYQSVHYSHLANIHQRLDVFHQIEFLFFKKLYTPRLYHMALVNELYYFNQKIDMFGLNIEALSNTENPILFWRKIVRL